MGEPFKSHLERTFKYETMNKIMYTGLFVNSPSNLKRLFPPVFPNTFYHHSTIEFSPKNLDGIELGKKVLIEAVGRITTDKVDALLVINPKSKNKHPHITLSTAEGVKPVESNKAFEEHPDKLVMFPTPLMIDGTEGYSDGKETHFK